MDGYAVAAQLRAELGDAMPLAIALTGYGQVDDRNRSFGAGFDHHLVKPVDVALLETLLVPRGATS
jgi:CheY-like chemotaxis protein